VTHGGPAVGAVPGRFEVGQVVQDAPHGCAIQGLADHDGGPAGPHGQHCSHPASHFLWHSYRSVVEMKNLPHKLSDPVGRVVEYGGRRNATLGL